MTAPPAQAKPPWAFWSPSSDESIAHALRLARVGPGTRFLDVGCGDGRVLIAAARLGATVRGIDIDPAVAEIARCNLAAAEVKGPIELDDFGTASLEADVIYAYLTPVTLSHLRDRLAATAPGTRVVTPRYAIAGWEPSTVEDDCHLYETPFRRDPPGTARGWPWRAAVIMLPADRRVLVPVPFVSESGRCEFSMDPHLERAARHAVGEGMDGGPTVVPIDLIFNAHGAGSVIAGAIRANGMEATVAAVFTREGRGQWNFGPEQGELFRKRLKQAIAAARAGR